MSESVAPQTKVNPRPFSYRDGVLHCDDISLAMLAGTYGTPLYVYSRQHLLSRLQLFEQAFASFPHTICYAVKANSALALIKLLGEERGGFDIVSGGELARVAKASPAALTRTVFAGVGKQTWELDAALKSDILLFNVESEAELALLESRAQHLGIPAHFSLRVNPDVFAETHPYISTGLSAHKFGIDINAAREIYRRFAASKYLIPTGVSVHIGSQIRDTKPFHAATVRVVELIQQLRSDGISITHLDAGGA